MALAGSNLMDLLKSQLDVKQGEVKIGAVQTEVIVRGTDLASLGQNRPNPFNGETVIDYDIPAAAKESVVNFYNPNGQIIKTVALDHTGLGQLIFKASDIPSGTYSYSLVIDGNKVSTKQMVLTN